MLQFESNWYVIKFLATLSRKLSTNLLIQKVGLVPNAFERTMSILTPYATPHENNTARDELWETLAIDRGAVAVDQETIEKHDLPDSMVFPWDTTKKVYIINAYHQLHCLVRNPPNAGAFE